MTELTDADERYERARAVPSTRSRTRRTGARPVGAGKSSTTEQLAQTELPLGLLRRASADPRHDLLRLRFADLSEFVRQIAVFR